MDNILLESNGFIKLTDFGFDHFSKSNVDDFSSGLVRKNSINYDHATEYSSPEVFLDNKFTAESDWWSMGVIIFEVLTGQLPFLGRNKEEIFVLVSAGKYKANTVQFSKSFQDFFDCIFNADINKRLGHNGVNEIKSHAIFSDINWSEVMNDSLNQLKIS
jgi:ribosomal protein S6 kinase alpha-1/2/3/6